MKPWNSTKITARAQQQLIKRSKKTPQHHLENCKPHLHQCASVHASTVRKILAKNGLHGRVPRQKPLLSKKKKGLSPFCKKHLDDPLDIWDETDETKVKFLEGVSHITSGVEVTAFQKRIITATAKYGGVIVTVWGCFSASGPWRLAWVNGTRNSAVYQKILKDNVRLSVHDLKMKQTWILQQVNDPKQTSKSNS